eukprot:scaffold213_cov245-Pinguiococcus_pyrenoidosus.AAC.10
MTPASTSTPRVSISQSRRTTSTSWPSTAETLTLDWLRTTKSTFVTRGPTTEEMLSGCCLRISQMRQHAVLRSRFDPVRAVTCRSCTSNLLQSDPSHRPSCDDCAVDGTSIAAGNRRTLQERAGNHDFAGNILAWVASVRAVVAALEGELPLRIVLQHPRLQGLHLARRGQKLLESCLGAIHVQVMKPQHGRIERKLPQPCSRGPGSLREHCWLVLARPVSRRVLRGSSSGSGAVPTRRSSTPDRHFLQIQVGGAIARSLALRDDVPIPRRAACRRFARKQRREMPAGGAP